MEVTAFILARSVVVGLSLDGDRTKRCSNGEMPACRLPSRRSAAAGGGGSGKGKGRALVSRERLRKLGGRAVGVAYGTLCRLLRGCVEAASGRALRVQNCVQPASVQSCYISWQCVGTSV